MRWAVLRRSDDMPIEGTLFTDRAEAKKRVAGAAVPLLFYVGEVAVMPVPLALKLIDAYETKPGNAAR